MKEKKQFVRTTVILSSLLLIFGFIKCKKETVERESKINKISKYAGYAEFIFPDTVTVNKVYKGKILYKGDLDSVTTSFDDTLKKRYIIFSMKITQNPTIDNDELKKSTLDTFGAITNRIIPFYGIRFSKTGEYFIDGIINDHVFINSDKSQFFKQDEVRYLEREARVTHKIIVVNTMQKELND